MSERTYKGKPISKLTKAELIEAYWDIDKNYKSEVEDRKKYIEQINNLEKKNKNQKDNIKGLEEALKDYSNELSRYIEMVDDLRRYKKVLCLFIYNDLDTSEEYSSVQKEVISLDTIIREYIKESLRIRTDGRWFKNFRLAKLNRKFLLKIGNIAYGRSYVK